MSIVAPSDTGTKYGLPNEVFEPRHAATSQNHPIVFAAFYSLLVVEGKLHTLTLSKV